MNFGKASRLILKIARQQLNDHKYLWALVFPVAGVGIGCTAMLMYTSSKPEVVYNRWKFVSPEESVKWDRPQNKLVSFSRDYQRCKDDPPLKDLLKEIYEDKRYDERV